MSDPRDVAHDKKVAHEKKHDGAEVPPADGPVAQPGKKRAVTKKKRDAVAAATAAANDGASSGHSAVANTSPAPEPPPALAGSLVVLAQLKDLEFHSRANLERLATLTMTIEDEL